jgi:hypothetical protein
MDLPLGKQGAIFLSNTFFGFELGGDSRKQVAFARVMQPLISHVTQAK